MDKTKFLEKKIDWGQTFEVGDQTIDFQHRQFFSLYNQLVSAQSNPDKSIFLDVLAKMKINATKHFIAEEDILKSNKFEDLQNHSKGHDNFLLKLDKLINSFNEVDEIKPLDIETVVDYLGEWIANHVKGEVSVLRQYFEKESP